MDLNVFASLDLLAAGASFGARHDWLSSTRQYPLPFAGTSSPVSATLSGFGAFSLVDHYYQAILVIAQGCFS